MLSATPAQTKFLSTPSARRATESARTFHLFSLISIHALREEGDEGGSGYRLAHQDFYPRPPRGGRPRGVRSAARRRSISIHALREEGDEAIRSRTLGKGISIHALREEGDRTAIGYRLKGIEFLSTPSARRATGWLSVRSSITRISIHALREEGDKPEKQKEI